MQMNSHKKEFRKTINERYVWVKEVLLLGVFGRWVEKLQNLQSSYINVFSSVFLKRDNLALIPSASSIVKSPLEKLVICFVLISQDL